MPDQLIYVFLLAASLAALAESGLNAPLFLQAVLLIALFLLFYSLWQYGKLKKTGPHDSLKNTLQAILRRILFFLPSFYPLLFLALLLDFKISNIFAILALLTLFVLAMPFLLIKTWQCRPLRQEPLLSMLKELSERTQFRCRGIYSWRLSHIAPTAAILGFLPKARYILITDRMLASFPPEAIVAVAAHEIAHSKRGHLLFMPLLLVGMLSPLLFFEIDTLLETAAFLIFAFLFYALAGGFFARLFEKEADLYGARISNGSFWMIEALKRVGSSAGIPLDRFSWHHGSLQDRISLLEEVELHPEREVQFLRKVHFFQLLYIVALLLLGVLWWI